MLLALIVEGGRAVARRYLSQHGLKDIGVAPGNIHEIARSAANATRH